MEKWALVTDFILISGMALLALNIFFLAKSAKPFSKKILIVFFASAFFFLLYYYSFLHKIRILGAVAIFFGNGLGFLLGPLLLFQLKSLVMPKAKFLASLYKQLIPFALVWLFVSVPLSISMSTEFRGYVTWYVEYEYLFNFAENLFFLYYIFISYKYLYRIRLQVKENYSSLGANDLKWYKHLLTGFALIVVLDTVCYVYELYYPVIPWNIGTIIAFSFVGLYAYLGYKGMFQSQILLPEFLTDKPEIGEQVGMADNKQKKAAGQLDKYSATEISAMKKSLCESLENKKLYLNETLSLTDLADDMAISPKKLSELLNQHMQVSFYNLVNEYRIREVTERMFLPEYAKYTLSGLANDCGFQSKATFNRIFKQKTGMSPSDYKETWLRKQEEIEQPLEVD